MTEATNAVLDWAFANGHDDILWECMVGNEASVSVARKVGFSYMGESPANVAARDGSRLPAWHAVMASRNLHQDGHVISVVLFDLDDTLFAHRRAVEDGVIAHLRASGLLAPEIDSAVEAARWSALEEQHYTRYLLGELDYLGQRRARATDFLAPYGVEFDTEREAEEWFETYLHDYRAAWTLHKDALPALHALSHFRLGIITNGVTHFQQPKLDALGITPFFEHVITSGDFGAVKPDPSIFLHACAVFGVEPAAAAYVGDRLHTDAIGAVGAGLTGVWLNRIAGVDPAAELEEAAAAGVRVVASLADLPALLAAI
jgi:putative hydrolase of the HAD superfamily